MKKLLQSLRDGTLEILECPRPMVGRNDVLVQSAVSLISAGTEKMLLGFGKSSLLEKARSQPERVKDVINKARVDGIGPTIEAVRSKLSQPIPLGYCSVGRVLAVGADVREIKVGERVVCNGSHGDESIVNQNLCTRIPDNVEFDDAVFTVVSSIGLQGIRLVSPTMGERIAVTGCGLIGLLTVKLLLAQGCRVLAIDFDASKLDMAAEYGAEVCDLSRGEDPVAKGLALSDGSGMDGVIITASSKSSDPVSQAAQMCRKRGRIVLVGVVGLTLNRSDFYEKELSFQVSCSYGAGRYDPNYEVRSQDYPIGYVRWTENRNFDAVLDLLSRGKLVVSDLLSKRFPFDQAERAYAEIQSDPSLLGVLFDYPQAEHTGNATPTKVTIAAPRPLPATSATAAFIGAGNFASRSLIPAFKLHHARLKTLVSSGGVSGVLQGRKNEFEVASTDVDDIFNDDEVNLVAIASRHDSHARYTLKCIQNQKHVYVEKPIAIQRGDVEAIREAWAEQVKSGQAPVVMVGYNRRFSPHVQQLKARLDARSGPATFNFTMNAGAIPASHWIQDAEIGGGRIIGEACHYIDLMRFLCGSPIASIDGVCVGKSNDEVLEDKAIITMTFEDGSIGSIHYFANGSALYPKERIESFFDGKVIRIDNFITTLGFGVPGFRKFKTRRQDKGVIECVGAFLNAVTQGKQSPIPFDEVIEVAEATIAVNEKIRGAV